MENNANQIIVDLLKEGISIQLGYNHDKNSIYYKIDGFYKSGTVDLYLDGEQPYVVSRYGNETLIDCIGDLVYLNYEWWESSKDKCDVWEQPDPKWLNLLLKQELVVAETIVKYK